MGGQFVEEEAERKKKATEELSQLKYESIYYEPEVKPTLRLEDCYDLRKFNAKIEAIENSGLSEERKQVMKMFAYRFIRIDFESVANYYAFNASEEEKEIIERLRLVLVDGSIDGFINDDLLKVANEIIEMSDEED